MSTIREQIIAAITTKLADITVVNGYATGIGARVERVRPVFQPAELPAISVIPQPETAERICGKVVCSMPITVEGFSLHSTDNPSIVAEKMLGDLISCLTHPEKIILFTLGGTHIIIPGDHIVGVTSNANALVVEVAGVQGSWTNKTATGTLRLKGQIGTFQNENLNVFPSGGGVFLNNAHIAGNSSFFPWINAFVEDIFYSGGGPDTYPDSGQDVTGCPATFLVKYRTVLGNPSA